MSQNGMYRFALQNPLENRTMPRLSRSVPKYRKHRASGQAMVTLNGIDHYLGSHGTKTSKREYDRLIAEWLAAGRVVGQPQQEITVVELSARYWKFAQGYYRKDGRCTGVAPAIKASLKYLKDWYGREPAVEFGPLRLKALRQRMVDDGHSRRYVNDHVGRIKRMYKWAASEQLVPESAYRALAIVEGLKLGRTNARETAPVLPVEAEVVKATLPHLPPVVADMVRLQQLTGMRPAEVCIVRPCDLDRSDDASGGDVWLYRPAIHKTQHHGRERVVFFGPLAQEILLRYLARDAQAYCFDPRDSEAKRLAELHANRKTPLSCGNRPGSNRRRRPQHQPGERYQTDSYRRAIHRACDRVGVKRWSPNRLRHAAATEIRKQFGLEAAQVMLGHAGADVTQVYAERDNAKGVEVARAIG